MRVSQPGQARALHYDRNPLQIQLAYASTDTAPLNAQRLIYTVPANRKCIAEVAFAFWFRVTAAGIVGDSWDDVSCNNGAETLVHAEKNSNVVGDADRSQYGGSALLLAGNIVKGQSLDNSNSGTVTHFLSFKGTEFDA